MSSQSPADCSKLNWKVEVCFPSHSKLPALAGFLQPSALTTAPAIELPKVRLVLSCFSVPQASNHILLSRRYPCSHTCSLGGSMIILINWIGTAPLHPNPTAYLWYDVIVVFGFIKPTLPQFRTRDFGDRSLLSVTSSNKGLLSGLIFLMAHRLLTWILQAWSGLWTGLPFSMGRLNYWTSRRSQQQTFILWQSG